MAACKQKEHSMVWIRSSSLLRRALLVDALASGAMGVALLAFAPALADLLRLPQTLLFETGIVLVPFAVFVGWLAAQSQPARIAVWAVIGLNAVWVLDSLLLLATDWIAPNVFGYLFVVAQAFAVGVLAELEYIGLRRSTVAATARA
jgi:hypothetical protein